MDGKSGARDLATLPANDLSKEQDGDSKDDLAQAAIAQDIEDEPSLASAPSNDDGERSENTPLLSEQIKPQQSDEESQGLVEPGTSFKHEVNVIGRYMLPMIPTFFLQYSLLLATMISVGHLGTIELGAVSLGSMTANITGVAAISGLSTALDTLCAQAYGSGRKRLVGLQLQRMVYFLWLFCLPVGILWLFAPMILRRIIPEAAVADLAGRYLRIVWFGLPGFACCSAGRRFLQAQGNFSASLYIMLFVAPFNALLNWLLVWHFGLGFDGAPIAFVISNHLLWILQLSYVFFFSGRECWPGFTRQAFRNWGPMVRLSLSGFVMIEAEVLAFEILVLVSSYFGPVALAANSVLFNTVNFGFQVPLSLGIAASTRIAHLVGGGSIESAKIAARVAVTLGVTLGLINVVLLSTLRDYVPRIFSSDPEVWQAAAKVLPLGSVFLLFDAVSACSGGILRGIGRQSISGYVKLIGHYIIGMPISLGLGFGAGWELLGLWGGLMVALFWCVPHYLLPSSLTVTVSPSSSSHMSVIQVGLASLKMLNEGTNQDKFFALFGFSGHHWDLNR